MGKLISAHQSISPCRPHKLTQHGKIEITKKSHKQATNNKHMERQQQLVQFRKNLLKLELLVYKIRSYPTSKLRFTSYYYSIKNIYGPLYIEKSTDLQNYFNPVINFMNNINGLISANDTRFQNDLNHHMNNMSDLNHLQNNDNLVIVNKFYDELLDF